MQTVGNCGVLYLVATPIGNLEDMTFRSIRTLQEVDLIAAEDTRHTGKLLHHFQITTSQISYHLHNQGDRTSELIEKLKQGINIALVSDAGMPCICDPGLLVVQAAITNKITIVPIPGVNAGVTALAASGLNTDRFVFEGFLPLKDKLKSTRLEELTRETRTIILYEAPHRLISTLKALEKTLGGNRTIVLARELTKIHEEFWRGNITDAIALYQDEHQPRGEYTIMVAGSELSREINLSKNQVKRELQQLLAQGMTRSQASKQLAKISKFSRREIYQLTLDD